MAIDPRLLSRVYGRHPARVMRYDGVILHPAERRVVATPFPRFFNYAEVVTAVPDLPFDVTEKVDGSLVVA